MKGYEGLQPINTKRRTCHWSLWYPGVSTRVHVRIWPACAGAACAYMCRTVERHECETRNVPLCLEGDMDCFAGSYRKWLGDPRDHFIPFQLPVPILFLVSHFPTEISLFFITDCVPHKWSFVYGRVSFPSFHLHLAKWAASRYIVFLKKSVNTLYLLPLTIRLFTPCFVHF